MPTMKQKADRIDAARLAQISAVNTKNPNANLPTTTGIEAIAPAILAIPTGGTENEFLTETDMSYMFDHRDSSDTKVVTGMQRFSQNQLTDLKYAFSHFRDSQGTGAQYIQKMLRENPTVDTKNVLSFYSSNNYDSTIDLTNIAFTGDCSYMFEYIGNLSSSYVGKVIIIIDENTFNSATTLQSLISNVYYNFYLKCTSNKIKISSYASRMFYYSGKMHFIDNNNNDIKEITFDFSDVNNITGAEAFLYNTDIFDRIHILGCEKIGSMSSFVASCYSLKSIDGLDFSNISSNTYANIFATSGNFTEFGKLGIVNGSKFNSNYAINLNISKIWQATADTIRDGQTIGYWYEDFANNLGTKTSARTHTITINTTLYNSLTQAQKELITNKGYVLASAS